MLNPRWHKVLRDMWDNKARTVLVVLSIAVGIFAVGVISNAQVILSHDLSAAYAAIHPSSAVLTTQPFDDDLVQTLRSMREVGAAEGRRRVAVRLKVGPDEWRDLILIAVPDYRDMRVDQVEPQAGMWPPPKRALLIERSGLDLTRARVDDEVSIKMPGGEQHKLRLAGLAHDLTVDPAFLHGAIYGYITFDTLEWLGEPRNYNELHVVVADNAHDKAHIQRVVERVSDKVEKSGLTVFRKSIPTPFKHPLDNILQALLLLLGVLGVLALALSAFLVVNTIAALLAQQVKQIGMMKAIGARTGQVMGMYLALVLILGLLALAIAMPLGAVGARGLTRFLADLLNFDLTRFYVPGGVLILEAAVALVMPLIAALYPIVIGTRITVREAISHNGHGSDRLGKSIFERLIDRVPGMERLISRPLLLSLRNTFRRRGRLALTLMTLTLSGAIFISVLSVRVSLFRTLDEIMQFWRFDVWVFFEQPSRTIQIQNEALRISDVVSAEGWGLNFVHRVRADDSEGDDIVMYAPPAATGLIQPVILEGRWLLPEDENAIVVSSQVLKNEPDVAVGDKIVLKIDGRKITWRIVGISRAQEPAAYVNYSYYARVVRDVGHVPILSVVAQQHSEAFQTEVMQSMEAHFEHSGLHVSSMVPIDRKRREGEHAFNIIVALLSIMAALVALVGGLGLMGTMSINVLERTREIGVMRAIGASDAAVLWIVMVEGMLVGVLSWFVSVVLALPLSKLLSDAVGTAFLNAPLSYLYATGGALAWLGGVLVLSALASFLPAWHASRLTVREVLAYE